MKKYLIADAKCGALAVDRFVQEFGLVVLDAECMTRIMLEASFWQHMDPWQTLLIMPGNGASIVKSFIQKASPFWFWQWPWKISLPAKRIWMPGENPIAEVAKINSGVMVGIKQVVVIDDVVSSGETIRKLYKTNEMFVPGARWSVATWAIQESANIKGYGDAWAHITVGSKARKSPINSLSTLVDCPEIAESYAERNFPGQAGDFLNLVASLR